MSRASWPIAMRRDHVVHGGAHGIGAGVAEGLAPADDAGVGLDPHQQDVVGRPGAQAFALVTAAEGVRHLHRMRVDTRDLHSILPLLLMSASSFSACARSASRLEVKRGSPAGAVASRCAARLRRQRRRLGLLFRHLDFGLGEVGAAVVGLEEVDVPMEAAVGPGVAQPSAGSRGAATTAARNRSALISVSISTTWPSTGRL